MKKIISVIVPVYNEEKNIEIFYNKIKEIFDNINNYTYEIIYVVDPSKDNSFDVIRNLNKQDKNIKYIFMSRRFGKEASMMAGLERATGNMVCIMDVDFQDPPELLSEMIKYIESKEYDSVATRRTTRKGEPPIRSLFSNLFYKIMQSSSNLDMRSGQRDYRLMNRKMVDSILKSKEKNRFLKAIYGYTGYKTKWIEFENIERKTGKSKWSFFGLYKYALTCIFGFTSLPLTIINFVGTLLLLISLIMFIIMLFIFNTTYIQTYIIINFLIFLTGIQVMINSILCEYLYQIFIEVKNKPLYVIMETEEDNKY